MVLIYNAQTGNETRASCDSELWHILWFCWGGSVQLGPEYQTKDKATRRDIMTGPPLGPSVGTVTWLD